MEELGLRMVVAGRLHCNLLLVTSRATLQTLGLFERTFILFPQQHLSEALVITSAPNDGCCADVFGGSFPSGSIFPARVAGATRRAQVDIRSMDEILHHLAQPHYTDTARLKFVGSRNRWCGVSAMFNMFATTGPENSGERELKTTAKAVQDFVRHRARHPMLSLSTTNGCR